MIHFELVLLTSLLFGIYHLPCLAFARSGFNTFRVERCCSVSSDERQKYLAWKLSDFFRLVLWASSLFRLFSLWHFPGVEPAKQSKYSAKHKAAHELNNEAGLLDSMDILDIGEKSIMITSWFGRVATCAHWRTNKYLFSNYEVPTCCSANHTVSYFPKAWWWRCVPGPVWDWLITLTIFFFLSAIISCKITLK